MQQTDSDRHTKKTRITQPNAAGHEQSAEATLSRRLADALRPKIQDTLETAADDLLASAARINDGNEAQYQGILDAARHLQTNRKNLVDAYCKRIDSRVLAQFEPQAPKSGRRAQRRARPAGGGDRLSEAGVTLLDGEDLEFSVTVSSMAARYERRNQRVLQRISESLARQLDEGRVDGGMSTLQHPLGIYPVLNEFVELLSHQGFNADVRLKLMNAFQFHVLDELEHIYHDVLAMLTAQEPMHAGGPASPRHDPTGTQNAAEQHLPGSAASAGSNPAAPHAPAGGSAGPVYAGVNAETGGATPEGPGPADPTASTQNLAYPTSTPGGGSGLQAPRSFGGWRQLLAARFPESAEPAAGDAGSQEAMPLAGFIGAQLASLQQQPPPALGPGGRIAVAPLYEQVIAQLEQSGAPGTTALSRSELDVLRLVSLLFEQILGDHDLSSHSRLLIVSLQLPVLRVALHDQCFFEDDTHPARCFLNELAILTVGWSSADEEVRQLRSYRAIEAVVLDIVQNIHEDPTYFTCALDRLVDIRDSEGARAERAESRLIERETGRAKVKAAKLAVQRAINQLMRTVQPAPIIRQFAADSWSKVLVYLCIRYGADQPEWGEALGLLEDLLEHAQPAASDAEIEQRELNTPKLLDRLETQMAFAGLADSEIQRQSFALYEFFRSLIDGDKDWFNGDGSYVVEGEGFEDIVLLPETPQPTVAEQADPELQEMLARIEPGVWLCIAADDDETQERRYKVSTVFDTTGEVILVNDRGIKSAAWDRLELAGRLRSGSTRIIESPSLVETAIDALLLELRAWQAGD